MLRALVVLTCLAACPSSTPTTTTPTTAIAPATAPPTDAAAKPTAATPDLLPVRPVRHTLAVGDHHSCALVRKGDDPRGRVKCWGRNEDGQLGLGDTKVRGKTSKQMGDALPFVPLPEGVDVVAIDAEQRRTCALASDGKLWCWGSNDDGELGLGDTNPRGDQRDEMASLVPVDLPGKVIAFTLGSMHTCAQLAGGAVHCWGRGDAVGDSQRRGAAPAQMGAALPAVALGKGLQPIAVAAGSSHTCVLLAHAKIKCFGEGMYGVIGTGDTRSRGADPNDMGDALPFVELGSFRAAEIVAGGLHACARSVDHRVKCWGNNHSGQLGLGHRDGPGGKPGQSRAAPPGGDARPDVDLGASGTVIALASNSVTTCALLDRGRAADGALDHAIKCWGGSAGGDREGTMGAALPVIDVGPAFVPMAIAPSDLLGCAIVVERERTIGPERPTTGRVKCWGAWVPGVGISPGTGMPDKSRVESLSEYTPLVELGADVRVVIPDA